MPRPRRSQTTPPSSATTSPSCDTDKKPDLSTKSTSLDAASTNCGTVISCDQIPNNKPIEQQNLPIASECDSHLQNSTVNGLIVGVGKEFSVINSCDNSESRMSALKQKKSVPLRIEDAKLGRDSKDDKDEKELQRASKVSSSSEYNFNFGMM